jgi:hypothetical protein
MAFTDKTFHQIEVTEGESVQIRRRRVIYEDGVEISSTIHRKVIEPGQDYSGEHKRIRRVCQQLHTPEMIAYRVARRDLIAKQAAYEIAESEYQGDPSPENEAARDAALVDRDAAQAAHVAAKAAYEAEIAG